MRGVQRGISTLFLVVAILAVTVAASAGYFVFSQNLKEKVASINSFEKCAKHYPVMESYPEQCNTPDGKHFTRELNTENEDIESLNNWTYNYNGEYFEGIFYKFKYPPNHKATSGAYGCSPIFIEPTDKSISGKICVVEDAFENNNLESALDLGYREKLLSREDITIKGHEGLILETESDTADKLVTVMAAVKDVPIFLRGMKPQIKTGILSFSYRVEPKDKEAAKLALKQILDTLEIQSR